MVRGKTKKSACVSRTLRCEGGYIASRRIIKKKGMLYKKGT